MASESIVQRREAGFTLVEVLVAMIILAVGLLALEALGIGAARAIVIAERQSGYVTVASDSLESALHQLRAGTVPDQFCETIDRGDQLSRKVEFPTGSLGVVTVEAIPNPQSVSAPGKPFKLKSSVYLHSPLGTVVNGAPCS